MHLLRVFSSKVLTSSTPVSIRSDLSTVQVAGTSMGSLGLVSLRSLRVPAACYHCRVVSNGASAGH